MKNMKTLTEFLSPENIRQAVMVSSKKRAFELIGKIVAESLNHSEYLTQSDENSETICPLECFTNLFKREKLGTTGLNQGVALPHAKLPVCNALQLEKPIAVFLQLEEAIHYEAQDNKEVDLIYAIMFPENSCQLYKDRLPKIAQQLMDKTLLKQLRAAESAEDIWQILQYADSQINISEE